MGALNARVVVILSCLLLSSCANELDELLLGGAADSLTVDEILEFLDIAEEDENELASMEPVVYKKGEHWKNGVVPYELDSLYDEIDAYIIERAMEHFENVTSVKNKKCVSFKRRNNEKDFLFITPANRSCYSHVGRKGGKQVTSLGEYCLGAEGTIMHELMHVLGFLHEQSRNDRDDYVTIQWENIRPEHMPNFKKYSNVESDHMGLPYDYESLLHYSAYAFSKNTKKTILPANGVVGDAMGQREKLSEIDIMKIRLLYRCF